MLQASKTIKKINDHKLLLLILLGAAVVRLVGLDYGLPLWLVGDEVSHIFGSLKMLELKTLVPALHEADFAGVMYYTPYLSYLFLIPFVLVAGFKLLVVGGDIAMLRTALAADPSAFFISARFISVLFGLVTIWLVYKTAKELFSKNTGLLAALILSLSFLHTSYSHWARHWIAVTFFFAWGAYILARRDLQPAKKYFLMALIIGIGTGFNVQVLILGLYTIIWWLVFDRESILKILKQSWFYKATAVFITFFAVGFALWPRGYSYLYLIGKAEAAGQSARTWHALLEFYWFYLINLVRAEPLFLLLLLVGFAVFTFKARRLALALGGFSLVYFALFYLFFSHVDRFILVLYPTFAVVAAYGFNYLLQLLKQKSWQYFVIMLVTLILAVPVVRYTYLLAKNDTRVQAINWVRQNVPAGSKVAVLSPLTRLESSVAAVAELESIAPTALRSVDIAQAKLNSGTAYHALNLFNVPAEQFNQSIYKHLLAEGYKYLIYNSDLARQKGFEFDLTDHEVKFVFEGHTGSLPPFGRERLPDGFGGGLKDILHSKNLGPEVLVYKLSN